MLSDYCIRNKMSQVRQKWEMVSYYLIIGARLLLPYLPLTVETLLYLMELSL